VNVARPAALVVALSLLLPVGARAEPPPQPADVAEGAEGGSIGVRTLGRHPSPSSRWDAFQGADHHPIDDESFYRIVGRDDLIRRERQRALAKGTLTLGGWALIGGGTVLAVISGFSGDAQVQRADGTHPSSFPVLSVAGLCAIATGIASLIVSYNIAPVPIGAGEADALARDHDRALRDRLGISETAARDP
jgi:hypothetical protein